MIRLAGLLLPTGLAVLVEVIDEGPDDQPVCTVRYPAGDPTGATVQVDSTQLVPAERAA